MKINLNNPNELTLENVRKLIASKDDSENRQIRVTKDGIAYLSDDVGNINTEGLAFSLETLVAGKGWTGAAAASDSRWVTRIYECLRKNWPNPEDSFIDVC